MKNIVYDSVGFDWDEHNLDKNWYRHQVTNEECEEIFFNTPIIVRLFVAFTVRNHLIRIISARDMNARETKRYDKEF